MFEQKKYGPLTIQKTRVSARRGTSEDGGTIWVVESFADGFGYSTHWVANNKIFRASNSVCLTLNFDGIVQELHSEADLAPELRQAIFEAIQTWEETSAPD